jgi:hypothetical protein
MKIARILALPVVFLLACSSETAAPEQDTGLQEDAPAAAEAPDSNPDGVPYPSANLGTNQRSGTKPGNRINNYKFYGYPDANAANGLQPMSLAQFYDPEGKTYKLIHIQASGVWCVYCQKETEVVVPLKSKFDEMKVVWLVSLAEGDRGVPSKQKDLDGWIAEFKSPYPHVLDPGNRNLGVFYDAAALPWNANVNAQTMEILQAGTGAHTTEDSIMTELKDWLTKIDGGELDLK